MRSMPLAFCMLLALSVHARGDEQPDRVTMKDEAQWAAGALAQALGSEGALARMLDVMRGQIQASIIARDPQADVKKALDEIIMPELRQHLDGLNARIAGIWASHFTLDELKALLAFYETPLGRKSLEALQQIAGESRNAGTQWARDALRDILTRHGEELKALGITPTQP